MDFSEEFHTAAFLFLFLFSLNCSTVANYLYEKFHRSVLSAAFRVDIFFASNLIRITTHLFLFLFFVLFVLSDSEYGNIYMVKKQVHGYRELPLDGFGFDYLPRKRKNKFWV